MVLGRRGRGFSMKHIGFQKIGKSEREYGLSLRFVKKGKMIFIKLCMAVSQNGWAGAHVGRSSSIQVSIGGFRFRNRASIVKGLGKVSKRLLACVPLVSAIGVVSLSAAEGGGGATPMTRGGISSLGCTIMASVCGCERCSGWTCGFKRFLKELKALSL
ncbi:hypothetical protein I3842_16G063500 [Carya illinoinensis]|uniref:Uncharacterized protein n=1 Tax=Carya illinoinensis TaxID=32201 RepID=A0A922D4J0_CARIL|nr:hypothetical protein I3842_16G063500 [Carya illinoinensis]